MDPLTWPEWQAVLALSFPVIILDEIFKFVSRNYVNKPTHLKCLYFVCISLNGDLIF